MIWLVRHASTEWNRAGVKFGQLDPPLDAIGVAEADAIVPPPAALIVTSPLLRARQTADILAAKLDVPVVVQMALIEASHGPAEGLHVLARAAMFPDMASVREADELVNARALHVLDGLPDSTLVVTHKGVIRALGIENADHGEVIEWDSSATRQGADPEEPDEHEHEEDRHAVTS